MPGLSAKILAQIIEFLRPDSPFIATEHSIHRIRYNFFPVSAINVFMSRNKRLIKIPVNENEVNNDDCSHNGISQGDDFTGGPGAAFGSTDGIGGYIFYPGP